MNFKDINEMEVSLIGSGMTEMPVVIMEVLETGLDGMLDIPAIPYELLPQDLGWYGRGINLRTDFCSTMLSSVAFGLGANIAGKMAMEAINSIKKEDVEKNERDEDFQLKLARNAQYWAYQVGDNDQSMGVFVKALNSGIVNVYPDSRARQTQAKEVALGVINSAEGASIRLFGSVQGLKEKLEKFEARHTKALLRIRAYIEGFIAPDASPDHRAVMAGLNYKGINVKAQLEGVDYALKAVEKSCDIVLEYNARDWIPDEDEAEQWGASR